MDVQTQNNRVTEEKRLTLYDIESGLLELLEYRDYIETAPADELNPQERAESLKATDQSIEEYVRREVVKVDNIAGLIREFGARALLAKQELQRLKDRQKLWEDREQRLKDLVVSVMESTQQKKLEGRTNTLSLRKCPASVEVSQPELIPESLQRQRATLPKDTWLSILDCLEGEGDTGDWAELRDALALTQPEPMKIEIGKQLKAGEGVAGCRLVEDKHYLKVD